MLLLEYNIEENLCDFGGKKLFLDQDTKSIKEKTLLKFNNSKCCPGVGLITLTYFGKHYCIIC